MRIFLVGKQKWRDFGICTHRRADERTICAALGGAANFPSFSRSSSSKSSASAHKLQIQCSFSACVRSPKTLGGRVELDFVVVPPETAVLVCCAERGVSRRRRKPVSVPTIHPTVQTFRQILVVRREKQADTTPTLRLRRRRRQRVLVLSLLDTPKRELRKYLSSVTTAIRWDTKTLPLSSTPATKFHCRLLLGHEVELTTPSFLIVVLDSLQMRTEENIHFKSYLIDKIPIHCRRIII